MSRKAVSLTLDEQNLLWLRARSTARGRRNLSETVDALVTQARAGRLGEPTPPRSVVGTIDIATDDPELEEADDALQRLFATSIARPFLVREDSGRGPARRTPSKGKRG